jgi:PPOX class probable FMN-dependent enzyme
MNFARGQTPAAIADGSVIESVEQLAELYRAPSSLVAAKKKSTLDDASAQLISMSPFALIGTVGVDGALDVSPRGGPPGFVRVLDERHLAIPDLNGNNLIDSLRAVVATGRAGLLVLVPGKDETLRINGAAWVTTDDGVLGLWSEELRRPTTAIVVRTDEVFMHCAKAFRRGKVWDPDSWDALAEAPDGIALLDAQGLIDVDNDVARGFIEQSYASDLANDQPAD